MRASLCFEKGLDHGVRDQKPLRGNRQPSACVAERAALQIGGRLFAHPLQPFRAETGRDYAYGGTILTPKVMGHWTHFSPDGYTETGAGGANLTVDMDSMNIAELGVGLDASWNLKQSNGAMMEPKIGVGYRYDFVGDNIQATSSFAGGGGTFASQGPDPAQGTFDVGVALNYHTTDNWQFTLNYDFEMKQDFDAHSGFVRAGYRF